MAPPNYAPGIQSVVTMYDVMFEVATALQPELRPERPSFTRMIYPLFERLVQNQWVNAGFFRDFGWGSASDFLAPEPSACSPIPPTTQADAAATGLRALPRSLLYQHGIRHPAALLRRRRRSAGHQPAPMDGGPPTAISMAHPMGRGRFRGRLAGGRSHLSRNPWKTSPLPSSRTRSTAPPWTNASVAPSIPAAS